MTISFEYISTVCIFRFRYYDKKTNDDSVSFEGKKSYVEKRGHVWVPQNKRPIRLKENLKELEVIASICSSRVSFHTAVMFNTFSLFAGALVTTKSSAVPVARL